MYYSLSYKTRTFQRKALNIPWNSVILTESCGSALKGRAFLSIQIDNIYALVKRGKSKILTFVQPIRGAKYIKIFKYCYGKNPGYND